jgi:hypothetical protein
MNLQEMMIEQKASLDAANAVVTAAENAGRGLSATEDEAYRASMAKYAELGTTIAKRKEQNTIRTGFPGFPATLVDDAPSGFMRSGAFLTRASEARTPKYAEALHAFLKSGGKAHGDYLSVGADGTGGYYLPGSELYTRQRKANGRQR